MVLQPLYSNSSDRRVSRVARGPRSTWDHGDDTDHNALVRFYSVAYAPITQPAVTAENYEIKHKYLSLVQQNQFGGSPSEDAG